MKQTLRNMRVTSITQRQIPAAKKTVPGIPAVKGLTPKPVAKPRKGSMIMGTPGTVLEGTRYSAKNLPSEKV